MENKFPSKRVGVKFCGHCNPKIGAVRVVQDIQKSLLSVNFVPWTEQKDILLIINCCNTACATQPDFSGPIFKFTSYSTEFDDQIDPLILDDLINNMRTATESDDLNQRRKECLLKSI